MSRPIPLMRWRPRAAISVAAAILACGALPASSVAVGSDCGVAFGYHYAGQYTSHVGGLTQCADYDEYFGWNGVDGAITAPSTVPTLADYTVDHVAGWIGVQFSNYQTWLQTGWYTGTLSAAPPPPCDIGLCVQRSGSYGRYIENQNTVGYNVYDYGTAAPASTATSLIAYDASSGCWEVYITYGGPLKWQDCSEVGSGAMVATTEMEDLSGVAPPLPMAHFGYSNPNTNQALRLHGGAGWVPWNATLSSWYTQRYDEHSFTPKYVLTTLNANYYFEANQQ